ncbi:MAG: shikimate kinase, partial [Bacteroidales bacterium]|nr:shikimate kinase [Bacteroidales bacterium]
MRIFFIGYMFSGKTTLGKKVAAKLSLPFVDLDQYFESKYKTSILSFFEKFDETLFRKLESETLKEVIDTHDDVLVSTGGGTACFYDNMALMKKSGLSVYVEMSLNSILRRMYDSKKKRPLLVNVPENEMESFVEQHLEERKAYYLQ